MDPKASKSLPTTNRKVNQTGDLCWSSSGPYSYTQTIGLLEYVKALVMKKFLD